MVATTETGNVEKLKDRVHQWLTKIGATYIKHKKHSENIYITIAVLDNGLECNISTLPTSYLSVRSPLWKVVLDKTGRVSEKMNVEHERFTAQPIKYNVESDIPFEFVYCTRRLGIELKRNNLIYAMKMLETMQDYVLVVQALNENKKLHQFKANETLHPDFIAALLQTYPDEITQDKILISVTRLRELFLETMKESTIFTIDETLFKLLEN